VCVLKKDGTPAVALFLPLVARFTTFNQQTFLRIFCLQRCTQCCCLASKSIVYILLSTQNKTQHGFYKMLPLRKWGHSCQKTLAVSLDFMTNYLPFSQLRINLFRGRGLSDTHELAMFLELYNADEWTGCTTGEQAITVSCSLMYTSL